MHKNLRYPTAPSHKNPQNVTLDSAYSTFPIVVDSECSPSYNPKGMDKTPHKAKDLGTDAYGFATLI